MRKKPSPALIVGVIALVMAMTGSAVGASLISGRDIRNNSVTGADIRNGSLAERDLAFGVRSKLNRRSTPADPVPGPPGPQGQQGPAGITTITEASSGRVPVAPGELGSAQAFCPAGTAITGTGFNASIGDVAFVKKFGNSNGIAVFNNSSITFEIEAQAICASGPGVQARASSRAADHRAFNAAIAEVRQSVGQ